MPLHHSTEDLLQLGKPTVACGICKEEIPEGHLSVTPCQHNFHQLCISGWLHENGACPICQLGCDTQSLKSFAEQEQLQEFATQGARPKEIPQGPLTRARANANASFITNSNRGRGRGVNSNRTPRRNNNNNNGANHSLTRTVERESFGNYEEQFPRQTHDEIGKGRGRNSNRTPRRINNNNNVANHSLIRNMVQENFRNYEEQFSRQMHGEIGRLVAASLDTYFQNLRLSETRNVHQITGRLNQVNNNNADIESQDLNLLHSSGQSREGNRMVAQSVASKIISGWKLTFDGSLTSVPVDEFIYRVNALTNTTLRGDYNSLCQNVHMLFEGKAKRWFWRYHHSVHDLDWVDICDDLRRSFKDFRTDFEIKESIRNLKQKSGETFENYLDHILSTADSLRHPLSDRELVEIILRNLQPEIRLELLHLDLNTISDLRKACRRRENLLADIQNKSHFQRPNNQMRRNLSEVEIKDEGADKEGDIASLTTNRRSIENKCWNCDAIGHSYKNCIKPRRVFCYGCGLIAFFLPNCPKCNDPENGVRDVSSRLRHPCKKSDIEE